MVEVSDVPSSRKSLPSFAALHAFEAVGRLSGVRRAAQTIGLNHGVISRHLKTLEDWAGTPLIDRANGAIGLTPEGMRFHARVSAVLAELSEASHELRDRAPPKS